MAKGKLVFIGMSGGVDSSVSATLLKREGYKVVGIFLKVWEPEGVPCSWHDDRREAMRVAAHLNIPLVTWDLSKEYKDKIVDYMLAEYKAGRTPNPDVMCNKHIKFGAFYDRAVKLGADYVATGHYAQIKSGKLYKAKDKAKDQSYFLYQVKPGVLNKTIFPVGSLLKSEVRKLAKKFKLPNADRKDSQGLCFIGKFDFKEFLKQELKTRRGNILNEAGEIIGYHNGAALYTLGERHGFVITKKTPHDKPYFIIKKDIARNIIVVSHNPKLKTSGQREFELVNANWFLTPQPNKKYLAQIRYHGAYLSCRVKGNKIIFDKSLVDLAPGQSVVVYAGPPVAGGGIVC